MFFLLLKYIDCVVGNTLRVLGCIRRNAFVISPRCLFSYINFTKLKSIEPQ